VVEWSVVVEVVEAMSGHSTGIGNNSMTSVWLKSVSFNSRCSTRLNMVGLHNSKGNGPRGQTALLMHPSISGAH